MKHILFHENTLCVRGSTRAVFDYACYNEDLLGNKSFVVYSESHRDNDEEVISMFKGRFTDVFSYKEGGFHAVIREISARYPIDLLYIIKDGSNDGQLVDYLRCGIHVMFGFLEPHGDVYAYVSRQAAMTASYGYFPYVPHIVDMPSTARSLRSMLGIPAKAFVLGRHGGYETFNLDFVKTVVTELAAADETLYFIFVNTERFSDCDRIFFLDKIVDNEEKAAFINSCDAMLHARSRGESFGLAICEFLMMDKPVLCWTGGYDRNHVALLRDYPELLYSDHESLRTAIGALRSRAYPAGSFRALVEEYSPQAVMQQFESVFLDAPSRRSLFGMLRERQRLLALESRRKVYRWRKKLGLAK